MTVQVKEFLMENRFIGLLASGKVINNMKKLYPKHELSSRIQAYYLEKIRLCLGIVLAGALMSFAINHGGNSVIEDGGRIHRNSYLEGDRKLRLNYEVIDTNNSSKSMELYEGRKSDNEGNLTGEIDITISEKQYSDKEIECFSEELDIVLMEYMLGNNESPDYVTEDLRFDSKIEGLPFKLSYRTDNPLILNSSGTISQEKLKDDGTEVNITVNVSYADYEEEMTFGLMLFKRRLTYAEAVDEYVRNAIKAEDKNSIKNDYFALPSYIGDKMIVFQEKNSNKGRLIFVLLILVAVIAYFAKDRDIEKEVKERNNILKDEYSRFVNRFTLFYTAGMPVKSIWMRLCSEYEKERDRTGKKNYLYEEMLITGLRMKDGMKEIDAYEEFGVRVGLPEYRAFISLIVQTVDKGKSNLAGVLKRETEDAFLEKVNRSKKLMEEASTKLLMPMFMMLLTVMIMIMFPAFCSFK